MSVLFLLLAASLLIALTFLGFFIWAARTGQFDDTTTPAMRMLTDDPRHSTPDTHEQKDTSDDAD